MSRALARDVLPYLDCFLTSARSTDLKIRSCQSIRFILAGIPDSLQNSDRFLVDVMNLRQRDDIRPIDFVHNFHFPPGRLPTSCLATPSLEPLSLVPGKIFLGFADRILASWC